MLTGTYLLWFSKETGLSFVAVKAFTPFINLTASAHALLVFALSMTVVLMPKILSIVDLLLDRERRAAFGGMLRATRACFVETLFSSLHAPIQMMFHSKFVFSTLLGFGVSWGSQQRVTDGISWKTALQNHWGHTAVALVWGAVTWKLDPKVFWWFTPVSPVSPYPFRFAS
jgi:membrane glycosyltransferase